jgi:hypothetical protein
LERDAAEGVDVTIGCEATRWKDLPWEKWVDVGDRSALVLVYKLSERDSDPVPALAEELSSIGDGGLRKLLVDVGGSSWVSCSTGVGGDGLSDLGCSREIRTYFPSSSNVKSNESSSIEESEDGVETGRGISWSGGVCGNDTRLAKSRVDVLVNGVGEIDAEAMVDVEEDVKTKYSAHKGTDEFACIRN